MDVLAIAGEEHDMPAGLRDGPRKLFPIRGRLGFRFRGGISERIGCIAQRAETDLPVQGDLVRFQSPDLHRRYGVGLFFTIRIPLTKTTPTPFIIG